MEFYTNKKGEILKKAIKDSLQHIESEIDMILGSYPKSGAEGCVDIIVNEHIEAIKDKVE